MLLVREHIDVCHRITREQSGDVSSSQRRIRAGAGHARLLPGPAGKQGVNSIWQRVRGG